MRRAWTLPVLVVASLLAVTLTALSQSGPSDVTLRIGGGPYQPIALQPGDRLCQPFKVVPGGTVGARYRVLPGDPLPRVTLSDPTGKRSRLAPLRRTNRSTATTSIPATIPRDQIGAWELCLTGQGDSVNGLIGLNGQPALVLTGKPAGSWLSALPTLADRASVGRASVLGGAALPVGLILLGLGLIGATLLLSRAQVALVMSRGTIVQTAAVAACFGGAFAVTTPPFQGPDEGAHQQYVEYLHDSGNLPQERIAAVFGPALGSYMAWSGFGESFQRKDGRPAWTDAEERRLDREIARGESRPVPDGWSTASSQPPLYYAAVAAGSTIVGGDVRDRLLLGRLLSVLLLASALAAALMFARAAVPSAGGLAISAAVVIAANPLVAFLGGSLNPDSAVIAAASWALAGLAVAWREGLTWRRAAWIGTAIGAGLLSKLTFLGLAIPMLLVGAFLLVREMRHRGVVRNLGTTAAASLPVMVIGAPFYLWALASGRGLVISPPSNGPPAPTPDVLQWITYTFQLYVGRIPPMDDQLSGWGPDLFISGWVGTLGWLDYGPPPESWRYFRIVAGVLVALALLGVFRALRRRGRGALADLVLWGSIAGGLMLSISWTGLGARLGGQPGFEQGRYLLPLIPIAVAGIALALRQVPSRVQRPASVLLGVAGLAHGVLLYLMTIGRYFA